MKSLPFVAGTLITLGILFLLGAVGDAEYYNIPFGLAHWAYLAVGIVLLGAGGVAARIYENYYNDN